MTIEEHIKSLLNEFKIPYEPFAYREKNNWHTLTLVKRDDDFNYLKIIRVNIGLGGIKKCNFIEHHILYLDELSLGKELLQINIWDEEKSYTVKQQVLKRLVTNSNKGTIMIKTFWNKFNKVLENMKKQMPYE